MAEGEVPARELCPCGYYWECGIWCGDGHTDGRCDPWPPPIPSCPNCGTGKIESHWRYQVVRCANCKEWLA